MMEEQLRVDDLMREVLSELRWLREHIEGMTPECVTQEMLKIKTAKKESRIEILLQSNPDKAFTLTDICRNCRSVAPERRGMILDELVADEKVTRTEYIVNGRQHCTYQWADKQTANPA
jgi:hypothetical protein